MCLMSCHAATDTDTFTMAVNSNFQEIPNLVDSIQSIFEMLRWRDVVFYNTGGFLLVSISLILPIDPSYWKLQNLDYEHEL